MLSDYFFEEYAKTAPPKVEAPAAEIPEKESYTRAEVDEIISRKLEEAVTQMSGKDVTVQPVVPDPADTPEAGTGTEE